jgi:L-threonylcarbamoyladenylate synthase
LKTEIIKVDKNNIDLEKISHAAKVLKNGGLVAFPTETVYGLGANALDEGAVKKIFTAKGRPSDNPLIVHIADKSSLGSIVRETSSNASILMDRFWPGPLTLVLKKSEIIPSVITAGLDTVAVRMPSHPVALALIKESGLPIAAPSANTSGRPSPTHAKHVIGDLEGKVDVILDAGSADVGLESTVLDATIIPPMILRPGGVTWEQLSGVLGVVDIDPSLAGSTSNDFKPKSPGMKYKHYSPKAQVIIVSGNTSDVTIRINRLICEYSSKSLKVGVLATDQTKNAYSAHEVISAGDRERPETIAANLFDALREFDERGVQIILAEAVDNSGIGMAIMNRMSKAAGYNIIKV